MFKLIKYELKGYYKELIGALIIITLLNIFLLINPKGWREDSVIGLSIAIIFAACIVVIVWNIRLFNRDLYGDTGYLMFTLPQSGYSILGSKLIASFIQMFVVGGAAAMFFMMLAYKYTLLHWEHEAKLSATFIIFIVLSAIFSYLSFLLLVYFSSTTCRVAVRSKKIGKLGGFIIFIAMNFLTVKIGEFLSDVFPQTYSIKVIKQINGAGMDMNGIIRINDRNSILDIANNTMNVNIAVTIFSILIFIGLFIGVSNLIEKKIDL